MMDELIGIICEILSDNTGIIKGNDNKYYLFSKSDLLTDFTLEIGIEVIFKPIVKILNQEKLNRAIMIEKTTLQKV